MILNTLKKWLLSFNDPRWAFLQAALVYFIVSAIGGSPFRLSVAPYFQYLADAFLHGQLHLRLMPPSVHDLVFFQDQYYLYWPPFPAILMMPIVWLTNVNFSDVFLTVIIGAFNVSMVALLLKTANQRGIIQLSLVKRAWLVIFFAFGTVHLTLAPQGNVWFTAQVIGFACVLIAYWGAIGLTGWRAYLVAGIGMALAMLTRNHLLFAGIWPAWYLLNKSWKENRSELLKYILIGGLPVLIGGGLLLAYNIARFNAPFEMGLDYHQMSGMFREDYDRYGAFNLHYLPTNFHYQYIHYPFPVTPESFMGGSLFLLSPLFFGALWSLWQDRKNLSTWLLFTSILIVNIPILLLMGTGWVQFGPRYTLDFTVPLLLLTANGIKKWPASIIAFLTILSFVYYLTGVYLLINS